MLFLPKPADAIRHGLESVVEVSLASGSPEPSWIAVEDGGDRWIAIVAARSEAERACGVLAASSDRGLGIAHRLGVGGAFRLPPSALGAIEALRASCAERALPATVDPAVMGLLDEAGPLYVVTVADRAFWSCQLGESALVALLMQLASRLEVPPAILLWPALVVAKAWAGAVLECWQELGVDFDGPMPNLVMRPVGADGGTVLARVFAALLEGGGQLLATDRIVKEPVHELPGGNLVGWWAPNEGKSQDPGWLATPSAIIGSRCRWQVVGKDAAGIIEDAATAEEVRNAFETVAVRVPGWLVQGLRRGTPAGLLVSSLADAAADSGLPLWIPNVDGEALQMALRLPGVLWVDGPAVPRSAA